MKEKTVAALTLLVLVFFMAVPFAAARAQEPPPTLLEAIARQESGLNPLAVNVAGTSHRPATRQEAERIIRQALAEGKSFDVGLMQVNSWWMRLYGIDPASLLDPTVNKAWGRWILEQEIARHGLTWKAVGKYHSPDQERGRRYAWRVYRHYAGQSASIPKEAAHAQQKAGDQSLSLPGGIWRNPGVGRQGRIVTFNLQ